MPRTEDRAWGPGLGREGYPPHPWDTLHAGETCTTRLADGSTVFLGWCDQRRIVTNSALIHRPFFVDLEVFAVDAEGGCEEPSERGGTAVRRVPADMLLIHKERVFASATQARAWWRWLRACVDALTDEELAGCYQPGVWS